MSRVLDMLPPFFCGAMCLRRWRHTGEIREAQVFVTVLGASSYTYAAATDTQSLPDWIASHQRALAFYGGVPALLAPDNLLSAVTLADRNESGINATYADMAAHYATAALPARPYKPKEMAKVEVSVQVVERWILASQRHHTFFSGGNRRNLPVLRKATVWRATCLL